MIKRVATIVPSVTPPRDAVAGNDLFISSEQENFNECAGPAD
jgi:hypothetical protein